MLRRILPTGLALVLFVPLSLHADDPPTQSEDVLDGKWESTSVTNDGDKGSGEYFATILIDRDKMEYTEGTRIFISADGAAPRPVGDSVTLKGTIKVDPKRSRIDFSVESVTTADEEKSETHSEKTTIKGIYNVDKDVLLICISEKDRPTEFSSEKGSGRTLVRLKRVKK